VKIILIVPKIPPFFPFEMFNGIEFPPLPKGGRGYFLRILKDFG
jgi:hypothetical protein